MKVIRIFNAQPVNIPHFTSLLVRKQASWPYFYFIFNVHIYHAWMFIVPSVKVEQFQGNYIKRNFHSGCKNLNEPIFKSSNARGVTRRDVKASNWSTLKWKVICINLGCNSLICINLGCNSIFLRSQPRLAPAELCYISNQYKFTMGFCESVNLIGSFIVFYLTIRLRTRVFYEQIVNEAQPSWLSPVENEGE